MSSSAALYSKYVCQRGGRAFRLHDKFSNLGTPRLVYIISKSFVWRCRLQGNERVLYFLLWKPLSLFIAGCALCVTQDNQASGVKKTGDAVLHCH